MHPIDPSPATRGAPHDTRPNAAADALRFWERRRPAYNAALAIVVGAVFAMHPPRFAQVLNVDLVLALFLLAVLANVAYCAAYPVDVFVQRSGLREALRRARGALFVVGTAFAAVIAQFVARGMVGG